jgi:hypothetical protein
MNQIFSSYLDEISPKPAQILHVKGVRGSYSAKIIKTVMENDEKRGLHTFWDKNE